MGVILLQKDDLTTSFLRRQESRVVGAVRGGCLKTLLTGKIDGEVVEQER